MPRTFAPRSTPRTFYPDSRQAVGASKSSIRGINVYNSPGNSDAHRRFVAPQSRTPGTAQNLRSLNHPSCRTRPNPGIDVEVFQPPTLDFAILAEARPPRRFPAILLPSVTCFLTAAFRIPSRPKHRRSSVRSRESQRGRGLDLAELYLFPRTVA